jgi:hypothetical protein
LEVSAGGFSERCIDGRQKMGLGEDESIILVACIRVYE